MKNLKVGQKLLVGFGAVIILVVVLSVMAIFSSLSIESSYTHLLDYPQQRIVTMYEVSNNFTLARRALSHMGVFAGLEGAEGSINAQLGVIEKALSDINEELDLFITLVDTDPDFTPAEKNDRSAAAKNIKESADKWYNQVVKPVTAANIAGERQEVIDISGQVADISNNLFNAVEALILAAETVTSDSRDEVNADSSRTVIILLIISIVIVLICIGFALIIPRGIVRPLLPLSNFMKNAGATGDITLRQAETDAIAKYSMNRDEIGQCIAGTAAIIKHITHTAEELETIAKGDLTLDVVMLSDLDTMGKYLTSMIDSLNRMFTEIHASTNQISSGSRQVAGGAQSLAQGATEQAATMEEFSSSIAVITEKTKTNADMALQAANLAEAIIDNAEKGNRQMDEMMSAVQDINQASQNISKVIKVIDDIAFQTNILALNAAVEAARAGQHGKGFAVVAEEVRNLASKSAEAAKETGSMIENSMEKAGLGARIANDTAASLKEIVTGINESSMLIREIAKASEEQSLGIEQINKGIDQVAQVVQQNAATAQESAAASQEMDSQASTLLELISQFSIKSVSKQKALPIQEHHAETGTDAHYLPSLDTSGFGKY